MKALIHDSIHPLFNSKFEWVYVHQNEYDTSTISENNSYIFVDRDIAHHLQVHQIELSWAKRTTHHQTVRIKSVNAEAATDILAAGGTYQTLTEIVTGKRGKTRGPRDSYHANDWTRSAFDRNSIEPNKEQTWVDIAEHGLNTGSMPPPNSVFDLPSVNLRFSHTSIANSEDVNIRIPDDKSPVDEDDKFTYPTVIPKPTIQPLIHERTLDDVLAEFDDKMSDLIPQTPKKPKHHMVAIAITLLAVLATITLWI